MKETELNHWDFRAAPSDPWRPVLLPHDFQQAGLEPEFPGPVYYRTQLPAGQSGSDSRSWLAFGGVSYHARIFVNGRLIGEHLGMWEGFELEISAERQLGAPAELIVEVEKPASLSAGPRSEPGSGQFPLNETMSGFLPYVWGHAFGGIWQPVLLIETGTLKVTGDWLRASATGQVQLELALDAGIVLEPGLIRVTILNATLDVVAQDDVVWEPGVFATGISVKHPDLWSPDAPAIYTLHAHWHGELIYSRRFGFWSLTRAGSQLELNGEAVYPRLVLSWGWSGRPGRPSSAAEQLRADFEAIKALGFNGVKFCLWVPPAMVFEIAAEMGLLVWLELPIWLPEPTERFLAQAQDELAAIAGQVRSHTGIFCWTLGCELGAELTEGFLAPLFERVRAMIGPEPLLRENSGSGEAYGGSLAEAADFYDHHFYAEPHYFRGLLARFAPGWRAPQPWLMGEYADFDAMRNFPDDGSTAEWLGLPQGARWTMDAEVQANRLHELGLWAERDSLYRDSIRQSQLARKLVIERTRAHPQVSGYVVTGEVDTPIATSGLLDDQRHPKFDPAAWTFNADRVLLLGYRRNRDWRSGGDQPAYADRWCHQSAETALFSVVIAGPLRGRGQLELRWWLDGPAMTGVGPVAGYATVLGLADAPEQVQRAGPREIAQISIRWPECDSPGQVVLHVELTGAELRVANNWSMWIFPPELDWPEWSLLDPAKQWQERSALLTVPGVFDAHIQRPVVCVGWAPELPEFLAAGGRALLVLDPDAPWPEQGLQAASFWREAMRIGHAHPAWGDFPEPEHTGTQFYGLASDVSFDTKVLGRLFGARPDWQSLLTRLDLRAMRSTDLLAAAQVGPGRLVVTTLRFQGGQGDQPSGLGRNIAGRYLLGQILRNLAAPGLINAPAAPD